MTHEHSDPSKECDICFLTFHHIHPDKTKPREFQTVLKNGETTQTYSLLERGGQVWRCPACDKPSVSSYSSTAEEDTRMMCGQCYFGMVRRRNERQEKEQARLPKNSEQLDMILAEQARRTRAEVREEIEKMRQVVLADEDANGNDLLLCLLNSDCLKD